VSCSGAPEAGYAGESGSGAALVFDPVCVIGRACRLPGAASVAALWSLLASGRCAVTKIPPDRWLQERLLHPRLQERGRSYTFAAGVLEDIWGFDPGVFGLSPREAEQMDPQQRLLCELTYEALEDAGLPPSSLAGSETGVYIGASALDYGNLRILDPAGADAYFATGNALSIISNRISYIFDLHGPSLTLDTACSSGLVALNEALAALHAGRIETAIVGGVNILSSPFGFIGFSQATMLSKTGLCQAFSAAADGYVRAEGGVVFVLQKAKTAAGRKSHASILASRINSDGRTSGISLPSEAHQKALLSHIYADFSAADLVFIEAHGTGTRVGDPVEASAIGTILGQKRGAALPVGSIKTNIGHMEAASGLAGVLKAMLALEHNELPASLHFAAPNPDIDFAGLNIAVASQPLALAPKGVKPRLAGINSFGFGGTNAHVVISDPEPCAKLEETEAGLGPAFLMISAQSRPALASLAQAYAAMFETVPAGEAALAEQRAADGLAAEAKHGIEAEAGIEVAAGQGEAKNGGGEEAEAQRTLASGRQAQQVQSLVRAINGRREALPERLVIPWPGGAEAGGFAGLLPQARDQEEPNGNFAKNLALGLSQSLAQAAQALTAAGTESFPDKTSGPDKMAEALAVEMAPEAVVRVALGEAAVLPIGKVLPLDKSKRPAPPSGEDRDFGHDQEAVLDQDAALPLEEAEQKAAEKAILGGAAAQALTAGLAREIGGGGSEAGAPRSLQDQGLQDQGLEDRAAGAARQTGPAKAAIQAPGSRLPGPRLNGGPHVQDLRLPGAEWPQASRLPGLGASGPKLAEATGPAAGLESALGSATEKDARLAFVYSGNGSQWAGMGLAAFRGNAAFRARFTALDGLFAGLSGWSLTEALFAADLEARLKQTKIAQPLLYALQASLTFALAELGIAPDFVLGHSVGEVAAAEAAGILDSWSAVNVIHYRSLHQELTQNHGGMAALIGAPEVVEALLAQVPGIETAAENSPRGVTVSGGIAALEHMSQAARGLKVRVKPLDLAYPFHSRLMAPVEAPLLRDLQGLTLHKGHTAFISTVTAGLFDGEACDAAYWWQNVREKVRFMEAVQEASRLGARIFVEIGPNPALLSHITDSLEQKSLSGRSFCVLRRKEEAADPIRLCGANLIAHGAKCDAAKAFGLGPGQLSGTDILPGQNYTLPHYSLPHYPWQRKPYRLAETMESPAMLSLRPWHPLTGARAALDRLEWHSVLDTKLLPYLGDHVIDGQIVLPGAAFAEMALAVAADWLETPQVSLSDLEILQPMHLGPDDSRQVLCKITPQIQQIEILSRKRLSQTPFVTHAVAKILKEPQRFETLPSQLGAPSGEGDLPIGADTVYRQAARAGLRFGPAFRQLAFARQTALNRIHAELLAPDKRGEAPQAFAYGLDPARLDACFHGLILVFAQNQDQMGQNKAKKAYIPVRFGAISLLKPGAVIAAAELEIHHSDARSILASFTLYDKAGAVIAVLREIRYQALTLARTPDLESLGLAERLRRATAPTAGGDEPPLHLGRLRSLAQTINSGEIARNLNAGGTVPDQPEPQPGHSALFLLLEGWATAFALHLARELASKQAEASGNAVENAALDPGALVTQGHLPAQARAWLETLLAALERSGLAKREGASFRLDRSVKLPSPPAVLASFLDGHQEAAAELLLAAAANAAAGALLKGDFAGFLRPLASAVWDGFETGGRQAQSAAQNLIEILEGSVADWPQERALRILQLGHGPLSVRALALAGAQSAHLSLYETEKRRLERARLDLTGIPDFEFIESPASLKPQAYDLVIGACSLNRLQADPLFWPALRQSLAPGAVFAAIEPQPSLFSATIFMLEALKHQNLGAAPEPQNWESQNPAAENLGAAGLGELDAVKIAGEAGAALFLSGQAPLARRRWSGEGSLLIISDGDARAAETASAVATLAASSGLHVKILLDSETGTEDLSDPPGQILFFVGEPQDHAGAVRRLEGACFRLKRCAERLNPKLGGKRTLLWIVTAGARAPGESPSPAGKASPARQAGAVASGVWAFSRTLANEFAHLDVRRADLAPGLASGLAAARLHELILSQSEETEIVLDKTGTLVTRFLSAAKPPVPEYLAENHGLRLERCEGKGLDKIHWTDFVRSSPGQGEIEIAVEAAGLNFRDVMWGMGLLPDEILEHGFAGPGLGLECAGRVTRVGPGVKTFAPGDLVMGFAKAAFATHVVVPQTIAAKRPVGLSAEMAATIPVAFLTAYYGLISCAQLRPGEWVLIHGGAGGVGLAALQIALWRGAKVIATAGSPEKRALLKALGALHVFDSRSNSFAAEVLAVTKTDKGEGVGVVLNSLAGEAMERSLACLRPFGRFVELGKRDYVANTYIGLRPFRRNLTYFGVDLDQLLLEDPQAARKLFQSVMRLFLQKSLQPLPYRAFASFEVMDAFRLMQQSAHIGKLIVKPPVLPSAFAPSIPGPGQKAGSKKGLIIDSAKIHLITGGFGGFGLATAGWLAQKGARHILLLGRKIAADEAALDSIAGLQAQGIKIYQEALDITDKTKLSGLFARFGKEWPELGGVIHAAMVLEDAVIAHLEAESFTRVLAPKVKGAENLDALTRASRLDYFLLYSSATVMIGNPGQAAYVAANGFLEGLARERRQAGLPALAVGWGAIEDAGVLTRAKGVKEQLFKRSGVKGLKAQEALDVMDEALREGCGEDGCLILASLDWAAAREHLPLLRGKSMAHLGAAGAKETASREKLDLAGLIQTQPYEAVQKRVSDEIVEEISRVLRLPREEIGRQKPLAEIGLDSLMAVELALALETRFSLEASLSASASSLTVKELAGHILDLANGNLSETGQLAASLAEKHRIDPNSESAAKAIKISQNVKGILG